MTALLNSFSRSCWRIMSKYSSRCVSCSFSRSFISFKDYLYFFLILFNIARISVTSSYKLLYFLPKNKTSSSAFNLSSISFWCSLSFYFNLFFSEAYFFFSYSSPVPPFINFYSISFITFSNFSFSCLSCSKACSLSKTYYYIYSCNILIWFWNSGSFFYNFWLLFISF